LVAFPRASDGRLLDRMILDSEIHIVENLAHERSVPYP
jgi:hypothetical protein